MAQKIRCIFRFSRIRSGRALCLRHMHSVILVAPAAHTCFDITIWKLFLKKSSSTCLNFSTSLGSQSTLPAANLMFSAASKRSFFSRRTTYKLQDPSTNSLNRYWCVSTLGKISWNAWAYCAVTQNDALVWHIMCTRPRPTQRSTVCHIIAWLSIETHEINMKTSPDVCHKCEKGFWVFNVAGLAHLCYFLHL